MFVWFVFALLLCLVLVWFVVFDLFVFGLIAGWFVFDEKPHKDLLN